MLEKGAKPEFVFVADGRVGNGDRRCDLTNGRCNIKAVYDMAFGVVARDFPDAFRPARHEWNRG